MSAQLRAAGYRVTSNEFPFVQNADAIHATPVLGTTFAIGDALTDVLNRDDADDDRRPAPAAGDVLVVGAHLDSVPRGPGIQDNGSGSATILELARQMRRLDAEPRNTIRFMWFGAEEFGLLGSEASVAGLPPAELGRIKAMINVDMIASPNFVRFRYDGDNSGFPAAPPAVADGPPGSGEIERLVADDFSSQRLPSSETPFHGRSDYGPSIARGIPAGGLFTGAEGVKSAEEARVYGGDRLRPLLPPGLRHGGEHPPHRAGAERRRGVARRPGVVAAQLHALAARRPGPGPGPGPGARGRRPRPQRWRRAARPQPRRGGGVVTGPTTEGRGPRGPRPSAFRRVDARTRTAGPRLLPTS